MTDQYAKRIREALDSGNLAEALKAMYESSQKQDETFNAGVGASIPYVEKKWSSGAQGVASADWLFADSETGVLDYLDLPTAGDWDVEFQLVLSNVGAQSGIIYALISTSQGDAAWDEVGEYGEGDNNVNQSFSNATYVTVTCRTRFQTIADNVRVYLNVQAACGGGISNVKTAGYKIAARKMG